MKNLLNYFKKSPKPAPNRAVCTNNNKDNSKTLQYVAGEIVWAKFEEFPYWPGMICEDPNSKSCQQVKENVRKFHVQFFGEEPTHEWVIRSKIEAFGTRQLTDNDEDMKIAYDQAVDASKQSEKERIDNFYACVVSDDDDTKENNDTSMEIKNSLNGKSKKRTISNSTSKSRKRIKMSIESEGEDMESEDEDSSYEPDSDGGKNDDEDYQSDEVESEVEEDDDGVAEDEEVKSKKRKTRKSVGTPTSTKKRKDDDNNNNNNNNVKRKSVSSNNSSFLTPVKSINLNNSISKAQSTLAKFSSPSVASSPSQSFEGTEQQFTHLSLKFLWDGHQKDKNGNLHTHSDYDSRTLHVPDSYINSKEVTPGMKQWWQIKINNYDTILFFKVGKFYELYHMDATVGVKELGLIYMRGKFAHCGFPEIAFSRYSEVLIQRGYKVARVEQTETPQALSARGGGKVVRREVCAVISKGTRTFSFMEGQSDSDVSSYLLAFIEKPCQDVCLGGSVFGVCFVDTSIGKFHLGQFKDDRQCSRFLTMISQFPPAQILYERHNLSPKVQHILNHELLPAIKDPLTPGTEFWNASKTLKHLYEKNYFNDEDKAASIEWPPLLKQMLSNADSLGLEASEDYQYAISSLGACTWYLKKCCIDQELLSMSQFEEYVPADNITKRKIDHSMPQYMILDGVTLTNLDIVVNTDGTTEGTLLELLDHCATPFGKRYFIQWLCSPSCSKKSIESRLDAIENLMTNSSLMHEVKEIMKTMPGLERILKRIHSLGSVRRSQDHPDSRAVFYNEETYSKKKIGDLISALDGFTKASQVVELLQANLSLLSSTWLKSLLIKDENNTLGKYPDMSSTLKFFQHAFDHKKAKDTGTIHPKKGVHPAYDSAMNEINLLKDKLDDYLKQQRKRMGCSSINYWGTGKNRYQLEIPESALRSSPPNDYHLKSQKKGFKRYSSDEVDELNEQLTTAEESRDAALKDTMRNIFNQFDKEYSKWETAVRCLATLDCLMSLACYSNNIDGVSCRPEIIDPVDEEGNEIQPFFELLNCRHPCISQKALNGGDFIPNDIVLGKQAGSSSTSPSCVLITGPNMGGKSTLMRQAGVILIMAQLGCHVPAEVCRFTPVDRVFTRLGARDRILHGESTFFVELSETSTIFQHATKHSLVLLDELGRGTATYDGTAIASAVVHDLANRIGCRTLFSTHYHTLVEEFGQDVNISLGHMACMVEKDEEDDDPTNETITFLYKFTSGACPKSYGFNAAKLAGLPLSIIKSAHAKAALFETSTKNTRLLRSVLNSPADQLRGRLQHVI